MAKKKTLKQQDFVKKKLKVGKPKQQPSNATSTSFVAKTIHVPNQVKLRETNNLENDVLQRLSLCKHHSATTRKEILIYFQNVIPQMIHSILISRLLANCIPLICDEDKQVRNELLKLLEVVGEADSNVLRLHLRPLVLFISNSMTHIVPSIQRDSSRFLQCVITYSGDELVRLFWIKSLKGLFNILGWSLTHPANSASSKTVSMGITSSNVVSISKNNKFKHQHLNALAQLIRAGLLDQQLDDESSQNTDSALYSKYLIPPRPQPYAYLKLFTREFSSATTTAQFSLQELDHLACEDIQTRRTAFLDHFHNKIMNELSHLIKEGGDCGRSAATLSNLLQEVQKQQNV
ncbi:HCL382Wp [Eremothecium sinecaudum]|uniref:Pre-rRNA-processing protein n=1 Tax=Eremothecium sinecaudum TaxID=45286 RepID=A0A120K1U8_9SACH|nr:HCL382Wp [Eremothecium sinecaudum]AMD19769.1 HCL382Wp [Eremothecium sinecaudum]